MGCGASTTSMPLGDESPQDEAVRKETPIVRKDKDERKDKNNDDDGIPTMVLPEETTQRKPPVAFEIPVKEEVKKEVIPLPPPRIQKLIEKQSDATSITLPEIEEKLGEAEIRRQMFLMQRAASASKRAKKNVKLMTEMDNVQKELENIEGMEEKIAASKTVKFSNSELKVIEDRNI